MEGKIIYVQMLSPSNLVASSVAFLDELFDQLNCIG